MTDIELHHLRCVVAIVDHGSFTAAAESLHLSQPALSYAISKLERALGVRLFERSPAGTRVTSAGEVLVGPARRALAEVESGRAAVDAVAGLIAGRLRIVGVRTATVEVAQFVATFHRRYPGVDLVIDEPTGDDGVAELVLSGRCDIGVMRASEVPEGLSCFPVGSQHTVVLFPAGSAPDTSTVAIGALATMGMIAPVAGTAARSAFDAFFAGRRPSVVAECSHPDTTIELVRGGVGVALASGSRTGAARSEGIDVRSLRPNVSTQLAVVTRPEASPAARAFCISITATTD